jgi:hypothetical protein
MALHWGWGVDKSLVPLIRISRCTTSAGLLSSEVSCGIGHGMQHAVRRGSCGAD